MGIKYNANATTDGLIFALDAANPRSYKRENIFREWSVYGAASNEGSKWVGFGNNLTLFNNSYDEWIVRAQADSVTSNEVGKRLVCSFEYYTDTGEVGFVVDNDGAGDNQIFNYSLTGNTTKRVFTDYADLGGTGVINVYLRRRTSSTATLYIENFQLWYEEAPIDATVNARQSYGYNKGYIHWNGDNAGYWNFTGNATSASANVPYMRFNPTNGLETLNGSSMTVTAWVYHTGNNPIDNFVQTLFTGRGAGSNEVDFGTQFLSGSSGDARLRFDRYPANGGAADGTIAIPRNEWAFVAVSATYQSHVRFFVNTNVEQITHTESFTGTAPTEINIGSQTYDGGTTFHRHWDGRIANMHVYNRALTDAEVLRNYHAFKGRYGI